MIYLETERLVLRDWREEDSVVFSRMNRDPKETTDRHRKPGFLWTHPTGNRHIRLGIICCRSKNIREIYRLYRLTSYEFWNRFLSLYRDRLALMRKLLGTGICYRRCPGLSGLCFQAITTTGDLFLYFFTQQTLRKGNAKDRIAKNRGVRSSVGPCRTSVAQACTLSGWKRVKQLPR